ncbi:MAG: hypothetical protein PF442_08970 [Desulfobulbaceae bacterium]|jgi:thioredoxin 1|nr:hypothetical protein [Desulfobulbaceae bacterium]
MLNKVLVVLLIVFAAGCSDDQQVVKSNNGSKETEQIQTLASAHAAAPQTTELSLIFFLNPNGRPCQMQDNILRDMGEEFTDRVALKYASTTVPADRNLFYHYGIRALPTLILADSNGNEIRRLTPGVKDASAVRTLMQSQPRS